MAEELKQINCPDAECNELAVLKADKRKKLYVECPACGSLKYNRDKGQKRLEKLLADQGVDLAAVVSEISENVPETVPKSEPEVSEEKGGKGKGLLLLVLGLVGVGGGVAWLKSRKA